MNTKDRMVKNSGVGLKKLYMLSKVAERKEVARDRLEKMAFVILPPILLVPATIAGLAALYGISTQILYPIFRDISGYFFSQQVSKLEFEKSPGNDFFKKVMGIDIGAWVQTNDPENLSDFRAGSYNYIKAVNAYVKKLAEIAQEKNFNQSVPSLSQHSNSNGQQKDSFDWSLYTGSNSDGQQTTRREPSAVKRPKSSSPDLSKITELLTTAGYGKDIIPNSGWNGLDAAFRSAVADYLRSQGKPALNNGWQWSNVAPGLGFVPNLSGAEFLVQKLIELKKNPGTPAPETPAPAATPDAPKPEAIDKGKVVAGLEVMFNNIASRAIKVDKSGLDFMRDSKNFRGVIRGLGGPKSAASYCVEKAGFSPEETRKIAEYSNKTAQELATFANESSEMLKVYNLFMSIKRDATRGFGRDRRGFTEDSLARSVARLMSERKPSSESETPAAASAADDGLSTQASIMRAIEIRKMAARKKLGI